MCKISVIVPVYGVEKYLRECLNSIIGQTLKDIEIICVDDGSKDNCGAILDEYAAKDERIKVIHKENGGYGKACNTGLECARGKYISIIEPDDFIEPNMFEELYKIAEENGSDIVKSPFYDNFDLPNFKKIKKVNWDKKHELPTESFTIGDCPLFLYFHPSIWSCIYRREFLNKNGIRFFEAPGAGWADNPFQVQTMYLAKKINYTKNAYYYWRRTTMTDSEDLKDWTLPFKRSDEIHKWLDENKINDKEILACLYARELAYINIVLDKKYSPDEKKSVHTEIKKMLERMDEEKLKNSKYIKKRSLKEFRALKSSLERYCFKKTLTKLRKKIFRIKINKEKDSFKRLNTNKVDKKLCSFDVFDTLITRTMAKPTGIFTLLGQILSEKYPKFPNYFINNFYTIRTETEEFARRNLAETQNRADISIFDIYKKIQKDHNLSDNQVKQLIELELDCEIKNIKPIEKNINILKSLKNAGNSVILISDMYLTSDMIRGLLVSVDEIFNDIKIYVSNEHNYTKWDGDIYPYIKEKENIEYSNWTHFGDNRHSDIKQAKKLGIKTIYLKQIDNKPYENYALENNEDDFYVQSFIGLSKLARLFNKNKSEKYEFGCSLSGPILYNYINFVTNQALSRKIKTLYFVARDGYILKQIADIIIKNKNLDIKTKYIYGSRLAWRIPDENNIVDYLKYTFDEYQDRSTLKFLAKRLDIDVNILKKHSKIKNEFKILKRKILSSILKSLLYDEKSVQLLIKKNKNKKELLAKYLKQELNLNEDKIAFVDVNGSGRTQDIIAKMINKFYDGEILSFYMFNEASADNSNPYNKISYISTIEYHHYFIELFCRNLDGQTLGYTEKHGKITSVLEEINNKKIKDWGYEEYLKGVTDYAELATDFEIKNKLSLLSYSLYKKYFDYITLRLDKNLADIIGSIPFDEVGCEKEQREAAKKYNIIDIIRYMIIGNKDCSLMWIKVKRSGKPLELINKITEKYGSIRKLLINFYFNKNKKSAYVRLLGIKLSFSKIIWRHC